MKNTLQEPTVPDRSEPANPHKPSSTTTPADPVHYEQDDRYRILTEASLAGVYLIQDGVFRYVNAALASLFGYTPDEIVDKLGPADLTAVADRPKALEYLRQRLTGEVREVTYTFRGLRKTGSEFDVEVHGTRLEYRGKSAIMGTLLDVTERSRSERELRVAEAKYRRLVEQIPAITYVAGLDKTSSTLYISPQVHTMLGFTPEEFIADGEIWSRQLHPADRDRVLREVEHSHRTLERLSTEYRMLTRDGSVRWYRDEATCIKDASDQPLFLQGIMFDITSQRQAEDQIRFQSSLLDQVTNGVAAADLDGRIMYWNRFAEVLHGWSASDVLGKSVLDFLVSPRFRDRVKQMARSILEEGSAHAELPLLRADGSEFPAYVSYTVLRNDAGDPIGFLGVSTDLSEKKRIEKDIHRALAWKTAYFEGSRDAIFISDANSRFVDVNEAASALTGYSKAELCEMQISDLQDGADLDAYRAYDNRILSGEDVLTEAKLLRKDGTKVDVQFSNKRIFIEGIQYMHTTARDISEQKRSECILRESEARYRQFYEEDLAGYFVSAADGRILECNPSFARILGWDSVNELLQSDMHETCELAGERSRYLKALKHAHVLVDYERELIRKDGQRIFVTANVVGEFDPAGELFRIRGYLFDVTARKRGEQALADRLQEIESIMNVLPVGLLIAHDRTASHITGNRASQEFLRMSSPVANMSLSAPSGEVPKHFRVLKNGRELQPNELPIQRAAMEGIDIRNEELVVVFDDGTVKHEIISALPLLDHDGSPRGAVGSLVDITARKAAEEIIRLQSAALESAANGIIITDNKGTIVWVNKAFSQMTGYDRDETIGKHTRILKSGKQSEHLYRQLWTTILAGNVWRGELVNRRQDGSLYDEEMTITPLVDGRGEITHFIAIKQDVTEQRKLQNQFYRAQRLESLGTLAGGIAHDLNNILSPIMLASDTLRARITDPSLARTLSALDSSAKRGADIIRQVLTFARGAEGERSPAQVRHLLTDVEKIIRETFPRSIEIVHETPTNLWTILADPTQVHQVFLNLCINARDAMPKGGRIELRARNIVLDEPFVTMNSDARCGPHIVVTVADTGTGIPPEILDRIFEPFFTTKEVGQGTGLGLATVASIVKSHGGFITVNSQLGTGTEFSVYLPSEVSEESLSAEAGASDDPLGKGERILVVDDEAAIREITRETLEARGYNVLTASEGTEALVVYARRKHEIDIVLTDVFMPYLDGVAMVHALRKMNPDVKVVLMSGLPKSSIAPDLTGVQGYLHKPYTASVLLTTLRKALDERVRS
jgi:PAS domain S-box-containing protein